MVNQARHCEHLPHVQMLSCGVLDSVVQLLLSDNPSLNEELADQNIGRVSISTGAFFQKIERHCFPRTTMN
ncbi:MAG: hypothetical protein BWY75_01466 [bacterium ADurb.Bin425]|nr:MAG: hypothetical protein BWY75_01466 [bacterium ADurb.Bin425]